MRQFTLTFILSSIIGIGYSQTTLPYSENFNSGIPSAWTQYSAQGVNWTSGSGLGTSGSKCAIADVTTMTNPASGWLQTPFLNLTSVSNPTLSFNVAVIKDANTFYNAPFVSLWYAIGNGNWQFIESWGPNSSTPPTNIINYSLTSNPPPSAADITWIPVTKSLNAYSSQSNIRFSFGADIVDNINNGWVVLDDVEFTGITGIDEESTHNSAVLYPNPFSNNSLLKISNNTPDGKLAIRIYDAIGNEMRRYEGITGHEVLIERNNLPDGMYFYNVMNETEIIGKGKMIIQ